MKILLKIIMWIGILIVGIPFAYIVVCCLWVCFYLFYFALYGIWYEFFTGNKLLFNEDAMNYLVIHMPSWQSIKNIF